MSGKTDGQMLFARKASAAFDLPADFARTIRHPAIQRKWQA